MKSRVGLRELVARGADVVKGDVHWSDEHRAYLKGKLKCQRCGHQDRIRGAIQYRLPDGTPLSAGQQMGLLPKDALAECRSCQATWPVFQGGSAALPAPAQGTVDTVEVENTTSGAELPGVATFGRKAEQAVRRTYSVSEETKKVLTREFSFEVPPGTRRIVSFNYARVWQHGIARVSGDDGAVAEIPFRVAVDMTVNLAQQDTTK